MSRKIKVDDELKFKIESFIGNNLSLRNISKELKVSAPKMYKIF